MLKKLFALTFTLFAFLSFPLTSFALTITGGTFDGTNYGIQGTTIFPDGSYTCYLNDGYYGTFLVGDPIPASCIVTSGEFDFTWPTTTYTPVPNFELSLAPYGGYNVTIVNPNPGVLPQFDAIYRDPTVFNSLFPSPTVGTITVNTNPVQVNNSISASASFTGATSTSPFTASWDWGDGTPTSPDTTTGTVTESNGSGTVGADSHTYASAGVYVITLTVTDKFGQVGTSTYQYVAVYDSSTAFAGGRSFDNPSNASPNTTGKVSFGISSKYNNSNVLTGSAKMNFKAANLDFASTSLSSLASSNGKAYLKGSGTLNGNSGYTFLASGIDGSVAGGNDLIRFQIKDSSNTVIYDSQSGAGDTADPTTVDATGNIRVH